MADLNVGPTGNVQFPASNDGGNVSVNWGAMQTQLTVDIQNSINTNNLESLERANGYLSTMLPVVKAIADVTPNTPSTQTFLSGLTALQGFISDALTTNNYSTLLSDMNIAAQLSQIVFTNAPTSIPEQGFITGLQNSLQNLLQTLQGAEENPKTMPDENTFQGMQIGFEDFSDSFEAIASPFTTQFNTAFSVLDNDIDNYLDNGTTSVFQMITDVNELINNPNLW